MEPAAKELFKVERERLDAVVPTIPVPLFPPCPKIGLSGEW